ncbi:hypothetical protein T03_1984 [Trichinella britovi]|uniref:Uncharacterized protein n=1 Tax=Trichinella britovi TaxID=45882 RepID=A0A0V1DEE1_TRIBR|nr:hypothetical protein T03_1984 [Trichinella britovi]
MKQVGILKKNNQIYICLCKPYNTTSRFFQFCFTIGPGEVAIGCFIFNQLVPIFLITNNNENCLIDPARSSFYFNKVLSDPKLECKTLEFQGSIGPYTINIFHAAFLV